MRENILLLCAVELEMRSLAKTLSLKRANARSYEGVYCNKNILLHKTGIGKKNARKNLSKILVKYPCECIISSGLAGAVSQNLDVGDIVIPRELREYQTREKMFVDDSLYAIASGIMSQGAVPLFEEDILCSAHKVVDSEDKKILSIKDPEVKAVDMESFYYASVAREYSIPFIAIRGISDNAEYVFPKMVTLSSAFNARNSISIQDIISFPVDLLRTMKFVKNCRFAAKNTAIFVELFLRGL
ncbi:MAG: hypothetical protein P9M13_09800 [Candidatus Ancaeobacter aquaticus]|nr:hypothetical protein [Candidatus Ancaeobacter aquaticus]